MTYLNTYNKKVYISIEVNKNNELMEDIDNKVNYYINISNKY